MRIGITSPADAAPRLAEAFARAGHEPVPVPSVGVSVSGPSVLAAARVDAARADLLVITSARTVGILWPDGGMPDTPVAVVGGATGAAVLAAGGTVVVTGDGGMEHLAAKLRGRVEGLTVAAPGAAGSRAAMLRDFGAKVRHCVVYRAVPCPPPEDEVDGVAFTSPSAVRGWVMSRCLAGMVVGAIGGTTARALAAAGVTSPLMPARPDYDDLADCFPRSHR